MGWNYLSLSILQRRSRWSFGMETLKKCRWYFKFNNNMDVYIYPLPFSWLWNIAQICFAQDVLCYLWQTLQTANITELPKKYGHIHKDEHWDVVLYARLKNRRIKPWQYPSVRPRFRTLFQHASRYQFEIWYVHSVGGTTCQVWVS